MFTLKAHFPSLWATMFLDQLTQRFNNNNRRQCFLLDTTQESRVRGGHLIASKNGVSYCNDT